MAVRESDMSSSPTEKSAKLKKKSTKKSFLLAHDLKLARILAGNDKTRRDRALKNLRKWFQSRTQTMPLTKDDLLRIWKGLFYSMWMSDKPLIQEECAENISKLVHALPQPSCLLFFESGLEILKNEWFGIDQLRLDKFLMFTRRLLRQALISLKDSAWDEKLCKEFARIETSLLAPKVDFLPYLGLLMHFSEIFLEELAKVSNGTLDPRLVTIFLEPFVEKLAFTSDSRLISHLRTHVFTHLMRQSDSGLEFDLKYRAWRNLGFPGRSIDDIQKVPITAPEHSDNEEESDNEKPLDPRAGRVNVDLPQIKFDAKSVALTLRKFKTETGTNVKSREILTKLADQFTKLSKGSYPLGVRTVKRVDSSDVDVSVRKAVNRLVKFDQKIKENGSTGLAKKRKNRSKSAEVTAEQTSVVKKIKNDSRKRKLQDFDSSDDSSVIKNRKKSNSIVNQRIESIFRRNSGTWFVTCTSQKSTDNLTESPTLGTVIEEQLNEKSPETSKELFPSGDWIKSDGASRKSDLDDVISDTLTTLTAVKKRPSLENGTRLTVGCGNVDVTPSPTKKVKINVELNKSQDVTEHISQILSSPQIPYDANKKPVKPLLKTPVKGSPINPFYKRPKFLVGK